MSTEHTAQQDSEEQEEVVQVEPTVPPDVEATPQASEVVEIEEVRDKPPPEAKSKPEGDTVRDREPGKSILPFTRVQKIMKADKVGFQLFRARRRTAETSLKVTCHQELPMVARDATFLISLATEEFIRRLSRACQKLAEREKRTTVQQRDVANIVRRAEEFLFLEEIIGSQESTGKRKPQKAKVQDVGIPTDQLQLTLRNFVQKPNENEGADEINNIVMNEDGAMYAD